MGVSDAELLRRLKAKIKDHRRYDYGCAARNEGLWCCIDHIAGLNGAPWWETEDDEEAWRTARAAEAAAVQALQPVFYVKDQDGNVEGGHTRASAEARVQALQAQGRAAVFTPYPG